MDISALCGDLGRGFVKPDHIAEDVAKTKRMMDLAASLGAKVLTRISGGYRRTAAIQAGRSRPTR